MKWSTFKRLLLCVLLLSVTYSLVAEETYSPSVQRYQNIWKSLIPRYGKIQYAGSMGFLSAGTGWVYGKNDQWETDLLIGIIPRFSSNRAKATLTVKQNFMPWKIRPDKRVYIEPLACGMYLNTILDNEFWIKEPEKYPSGYYDFSTKLRMHIFAGQRISYMYDKNDLNKKITLFYELSTSDLYFISAATNKYLRLRDVLSLSFGVKLQLF